MLDAKIIGDEALKFGWPATLADDGPFWTHQLSEPRLREIMDFLRTVVDQEWDQIRKDAIKDVIDFDPGNSQFSISVKSLHESWQRPPTTN